MILKRRFQVKLILFTLCIFYFSCTQVHSDRCNGEYQNRETNQFDVLLPRNTSNGNPTVSDLLHTNEKGQKALNDLVDHFESVREVYSAENISSSGSFCNLGIDPRLERRAKYYNFGEPLNCGFQFDKEELGTGQNLDAVFVTQAVQDLADTLEKVSPEVRKSYGIEWKDIFINDVVDVKMRRGDIRSCRTYRTMSVRFNNTWSIATKFQKHPWNHYAKAMDREVLTEWVVHDGVNTRPLLLNMPKCDTEKKQVGNYSSSTASFWNGSKWDDWAWFWTKDNKITYEKNWALRLAKAASNYPTEIVEDSGSISAGSILIIPVVLSLIPIGLFQHVSTPFLILYALVTDVFSCLPVLIKGIELPTIGYKPYYGITSKMYGSAEPGELIFGQTWAAKCTMNSRIRNTGWAFTMIGISAMIIGFTLEISVCVLTRKRAAEFEDEKKELLRHDKSMEKLDESSRNAGLLWYWSKKNTTA